MTYRGRYHATPQTTRVLDLVLADDSNPRSVLFQAMTIDGHLGQLPHTDPDGVMTGDQRVARQLVSEIELADMHALGESVSRRGHRARLERLTRRIEGDMIELSDLITQHFFSHSKATRVSGNPGAGGDS
jgi:uncharacterized alpha-E superfamily protein